MYCRKCGRELNDGAMFCPSCGQKIETYVEKKSDIDTISYKTDNSAFSRAKILIEDGEFKRAEEYLEKALDIEPTNGEIYLFKLMADYKVRNCDDLRNCDKSVLDNANYAKAVRYGNSDIVKKLKEYADEISRTAMLNDLQKQYEKACSYMLSTFPNYEKAIEVFLKIKGYKDSDNKIKECEEKQAIYKVKVSKRRKIFGICIAAICVVALTIFIIYGYILPRQENIKKHDLASAEIGDKVLFGSYEQDGVLTNGKEDVSWIVADKGEDKILLISEYALDRKCYNDKGGYVNWETCTLRSWLNGEFFETVFSADEQTKVVSVPVPVQAVYDHTTHKNETAEDWIYCALYEKPVLESTEVIDKVFIMSAGELIEYLKSPSDRVCEGTPFALDNSGNRTGTCFYWTRSSAADDNGHKLAFIGLDGYTNTEGANAYSNSVFVRPVCIVKYK